MSIPTNVDLLRLEQRRQAAYNAVMDALSQRWTMGQKVGAFLSGSQIKPSVCTIISTHGDGRVSVRLEKPDRRGYHTIKQVHWTRIS